MWHRRYRAGMRILQPDQPDASPLRFILWTPPASRAPLYAVHVDLVASDIGERDYLEAGVVFGDLQEPLLACTARGQRVKILLI